MVYQDNEKDFDHDKDDLMDYETSDCLKDWSDFDIVSDFYVLVFLNSMLSFILNLF